MPSYVNTIVVFAVLALILLIGIYTTTAYKRAQRVFHPPVDPTDAHTRVVDLEMQRNAVQSEGVSLQITPTLPEYIPAYQAVEAGAVPVEDPPEYVGHNSSRPLL